MGITTSSNIITIQNDPSLEECLQTTNKIVLNRLQKQTDTYLKEFTRRSLYITNRYERFDYNFDSLNKVNNDIGYLKVLNLDYLLKTPKDIIKELFIDKEYTDINSGLKYMYVNEVKLEFNEENIKEVIEIITNIQNKYKNVINAINENNKKKLKIKEQQLVILNKF